MHLNMQFLTIIFTIFLLGSVSAAPAVVLPSSLSLPPAPTNKGAPVPQPTPPGKDGQVMGPRKEDPVIDVMKGFHFFLDQYEKKKNYKAPSESKSKDRARAFRKEINEKNWRRMSPEERDVTWKKFWDKESRERGQDLAMQTRFMYDFATKLQQKKIKKQGKPDPRLEKFIKSPVFAKENMLPALEILKKRAVPVEPTPLTEEQRQVMSNKLAENMHKHESSEQVVQSADDNKLLQHRHFGMFNKIARALQGPGDHKAEEVKQGELTDPEKYFTEMWKNHGPGKDDMTAEQKENTNGPPSKNHPPPNPEAYAKEQWYTHHWGENPATNGAGHLSQDQENAAMAVRRKSGKLQSKAGSKADHAKGNRLWYDLVLSLRELRTNHHEVLNKTNAPLDAKDPSSTWNDSRASSTPLLTAVSETPVLLPRALENDEVLRDDSAPEVGHGTLEDKLHPHPQPWESDPGHEVYTPKDKLPPSAYDSAHKPNDTVLETMTGNAIKSEPELQKRDGEVEDERPTLPRLPKREEPCRLNGGEGGIMHGYVLLPECKKKMKEQDERETERLERLRHNMRYHAGDDPDPDHKAPPKMEIDGVILPKLRKREDAQDWRMQLPCHHHRGPHMSIAPMCEHSFGSKDTDKKSPIQPEIGDKGPILPKLPKRDVSAPVPVTPHPGAVNNHTSIIHTAKMEVTEKHKQHSMEKQEKTRHEVHSREKESHENLEEENLETENMHKIRHGSEVASRNSTTAGIDLQYSPTKAGPHLNHTVMQEIGERQQKESPTKTIDINDSSDVGPTEEPLLRKRDQDDAKKQYERIWNLCHDDNWRTHHLQKDQPSICQKVGHGNGTTVHVGPAGEQQSLKVEKNQHGLRKRGVIPVACLVPWDGAHPGHNLPAGCAELIGKHKGHDAAKEKAEQQQLEQNKPAKTQIPDKTLILPKLRTRDVMPELTLEECLAPNDGMDHPRAASPECKAMIRKLQEEQAAKEKAEQQQLEQEKLMPRRNKKLHATHDPDNHFPSNAEQKPSGTQTADKITLILPNLRKREAMPKLTLAKCLGTNVVPSLRIPPPGCREFLREHGSHDAAQEKAEEQRQEAEQQRQELERKRKLGEKGKFDWRQALQRILDKSRNPLRKGDSCDISHRRVPLARPWCKFRHRHDNDIVGGSGAHSNHNGATEVEERRQLDDLVGGSGAHSNHTGVTEVEERRQLNNLVGGSGAHSNHTGATEVEERRQPENNTVSGSEEHFKPIDLEIQDRRLKDDKEEVVGGSGEHSNHVGAMEIQERREPEAIVGGPGMHWNHTGATEIEERRLHYDKEEVEVVGGSGEHSEHTGAMEIQERRREGKKNDRRIGPPGLRDFRKILFRDVKEKDKLSKRQITRDNKDCGPFGRWCGFKYDDEEVVGGSGEHSKHTGAMEIQERRGEGKDGVHIGPPEMMLTVSKKDLMKDSRENKLSKRLWFPDYTKEEAENIVKSIKESGKDKDMKVELEKYRKAHPDDKAARRFHYEKDENENENDGKTTAAAHERRQLGDFPHLGSHMHFLPFRYNHTGSHHIHRIPFRSNQASGFNHLNHKVQHEDKFNKLSKRNLEAPPHNHTFTEPEVWFLEYSLKKAKKKPKLQVFLDWMREHDRLHEAQEQRERDTIAQLNNHTGHRPEVEHRLTNNNHSDHSPSQESREGHWVAHRKPFMRGQAEVEEMGPAQLLKRWVRHSLTWSNVERPTIHKAPAAAPSPAPDASTTPAAHA